MHARQRPDQRIAVRAESEWPIDGLSNARFAKRRNALETEFQSVGDSLQIGLQQLVAEIPRRSVHLPGRAFGLVRAEQHAVAFLTEIDIGLVIDAAGQPLVRVDDGIDPFRQKVVMLHRLQGQIESSHVTDFARPQPAAIDHVFGVNDALVGCDIPCAVGLLCRGSDRRVGEVLRTIVPGRFGKGIGGAGRVEITILIVPKGCKIVFGIDQRVAFRQFLGADEFLLQSHIACFGALALEIVVPGLVRCQIKSAGHVEADRMARQFLNLLVKPNCIALEA